MLRRFPLVACLLAALSAALLAGSARPDPAGAATGSTARASTRVADRVAAARAAAEAAEGTAGGTADRTADRTAANGVADRAGAKSYAVGMRTLQLRRGADRPLPTLVWYPATGKRGGEPRKGARPAGGRFPLVIYSHGRGSLPLHHGQVTAKLAAAGFVVVAPTYPRTNKQVPVDRADIPNQPADASAVLTAVLALDSRAGDPLAGHLDAGRIAAAGHSAGGSTTNGLLSTARDTRIRAGVVIAGRPMGEYTGPPAPVLFVHGDADPVVTYDNGRRAYERVPWPKAFLTLVDQQHGEYLGTGAKGNAQTISTIVDFLRWSLSGDAAARQRLTTDAALPGATRYEEDLGPV